MMHCVSLGGTSQLLSAQPAERHRGEDVSSISNNLDDDNQCRHNGTKLKSRRQHCLAIDI